MNAQALDPRTVRPSAIAGSWYPGSPRALEKMVDDFLAQASSTATADEIVGLISPHAGYMYSGPTAGHAYRQLDGLDLDVVVLLGPSHYEDYGPVSVTANKFYSTPLGEVPLALDLIEDLGTSVPITRVERDREHSLEIQLPFLQRVLGRFELIPLLLSLPLYILGPQAQAPVEALAAALARVVRGRRVVLVASTDLSHLPDYAAVEESDARLAKLIEAYDLTALQSYLMEGRQCRACGDAAVVAMLSAARDLGADRTRILYRTNSGDVTGAREHSDYTVGYMAAGAYRTARTGR